jgi:hypothetical protein
MSILALFLQMSDPEKQTKLKCKYKFVSKEHSKVCDCEKCENKNICSANLTRLKVMASFNRAKI